MLAESLIELLNVRIPNDFSSQITSNYYIEHLLKDEYITIKRAMDLGCGEGDTLDIFKKYEVNWVGLDIENSPEVNLRKRNDGEFYTFNGIDIPFDSNSFDLIYSNQVFEHVRYPTQLLAEINRVLKPNGYFIGSTSQMEPYHSYSFWNYTPYGFTLLLEEASFNVIELRPSIDALTLIVRVGLGRPQFFSHWWSKESPLNRIIDLLGAVKKLDNRSINAIKLLFCGQFCFMARK